MPQVRNPATGEPQYTSLTPADERSSGSTGTPQALRQFGGAYEDKALQAYVTKTGNRVKAASELRAEPFTFTLLDSDVVNAFALPGGYVYVTRGLVALTNNEAELAGVLGHEIGHVTAATARSATTRRSSASMPPWPVSSPACCWAAMSAAPKGPSGWPGPGPGHLAGRPGDRPGLLIARPGVRGRSAGHPLSGCRC